MRNATPRARSGPPPDPNALRRDRPSDQTTWMHLPTTGREGDPPTWPLSRPNAHEVAIWKRVWALPQAVAWEAGHYFDTVACYVRALHIADNRLAKAADRTLVRQYQDSLGLTDAGMRSNRWIIDGAQQQTTRADDTHRRSAKSRLRSIAGGVAS